MIIKVIHLVKRKIKKLFNLKTKMFKFKRFKNLKIKMIFLHQMTKL